MILEIDFSRTLGSQEAEAKLKEKPSGSGRRPSKRGAFGVGSVIFGVDGRWAAQLAAAEKLLLLDGGCMWM